MSRKSRDFNRDVSDWLIFVKELHGGGDDPADRRGGRTEWIPHLRQEKGQSGHPTAGCSQQEAPTVELSSVQQARYCWYRYFQTDSPRPRLLIEAKSKKNYLNSPFTIINIKALSDDTGLYRCHQHG